MIILYDGCQTFRAIYSLNKSLQGRGMGSNTIPRIIFLRRKVEGAFIELSLMGDCSRI